MTNLLRWFLDDLTAPDLTWRHVVAGFALVIAFLSIAGPVLALVFLIGGPA